MYTIHRNTFAEMRMVSPSVRALTCFVVLVLSGCGASAGAPRRPPLRVGTTGEFPPFSMATDGGYAGVDIELAHNLGRELGRPIEFVRTSYATMTRDAIAHRFDVALAAFCITAERALAVDFSQPYHEYGRVAVVRCDETDRYPTLDDLNQTGVRIRVRSGGTDSQFSRQRFPNAHVQDTASITSWYERLAAGDDDVIIASPFEYRSHPGLCTAFDGARFAVLPIAVVLPKGSPLLGAVNSWVERRLSDGTVQRLLQAFGVP